uniref:RND transporter n=1 Tax=Candidatus Kentrum sp. TUN TaxID=2126343 RepID=A0A451A3T0_9GAMM|nr:MAG: hypothetical protein BECKTUN1418F_GA0071002_10603 [Candidatus Kentron sp. TUN]VFK58788.1 MAG: hypothetical protein BECKTUN1418D_GA0071000_10902 [Candidatus Kentron sp. TUN]VFK60652.1 MAG: hypothetical protein BECKTUN1418E_GA0071001_10593 [Candidatus Kentron sp. TUN]
MNWLHNIPWPFLIVVALVLGLAPFTPQPHLWEKLQWLVAGQLSRPIDIFDLFLHGTPVVLLFLKAVLTLTKK